MVAAFEGWNDAGDAASSAARYLCERWGGRAVAEVDPEELFDFTVTRPQVTAAGGGRRRIEWPRNQLWAAEVPGGARHAVFLQGTEPQLRWRSFCAAVVELARQVQVEMVVTLGALLAEVPHTRPVPVSSSSADPALAERLGLAPSRYEGPTGIVGVLGEALAASGIPCASMWASVPHYLAQTPSPKATLALVRRTADLLGAAVDTTDLEIAAASYERQVSELVADDEEAALYVARLEAEVPEPPPGPLPSAESLAQEAERFLRRHRD
jgi:proteasome assembly chaperone (PAC2) family protein